MFIIFLISHRKSGFPPGISNHIISLRAFPITFFYTTKSAQSLSQGLLKTTAMTSDLCLGGATTSLLQVILSSPSLLFFTSQKKNDLSARSWGLTVGQLRGSYGRKEILNIPTQPCVGSGAPADRHAYIIGNQLENVCPTSTISRFMLTEKFTISEKTCLFMEWYSLHFQCWKVNPQELNLRTIV